MDASTRTAVTAIYNTNGQRGHDLFNILAGMCRVSDSGDKNIEQVKLEHELEVSKTIYRDNINALQTAGLLTDAEVTEIFTNGIENLKD